MPQEREKEKEQGRGREIGLIGAYVGLEVGGMRASPAKIDSNKCMYGGHLFVIASFFVFES